MKSFLLLRDDRTEQLKHARETYEDIKEEIAIQSEHIESEQSEVRRHAETRVAIQTRLQRLEEQVIAKRDQLELLQQRYHDFLRSKQEADARADQILERIERDEFELADQKDSVQLIADRIDELQKSIEEHELIMSSTRRQIEDHDGEIEERERSIGDQESRQQSLSVRLQELTDMIVVELDNKLQESGYSIHARKQAQQAFLDRLSRIQNSVHERIDFTGKTANLIGDGKKSAISVMHEWTTFLEDLSQSVRLLSELFSSYDATIPSFIDDLLAPEGIITKKHEIDQDLEESRNLVTLHRQAIQTLREENRGLGELLEQYREQLTHLKVSLSENLARQASTKSLVENLEKRITEQRYLHSDAQRDAQVAADRVEEAIEQMAIVRDDQRSIDEEKESLEGQLIEIISVIERENERLSGERQKINQRYNDLSELRTSIDKFTFHIESIQEQIQSVYRTFFDTYGKSLKEFEERLEDDLGDVSALRERLAAVKKQIQGMGYINHMAEEEFAEIKERYDFLTQQMDDLLRAKNDLTRVIEEIRRRSEELFLDSYHKIRINFQEMFHRMFGGGRAELRLLDPEHVLETGIDILAQPPGKKLDRLAPLSGGEKSLTAVALLFATYKVKPSPFCILDEIDAALDDRNIGYFLSVLEDFAESSQFIIITHNKHTVMGSRTLLGVTMQERGVSKAISYRMGWDVGEEVIHDVQVDTSVDNEV